MSLKINKNRSNIDNLELQETIEEFVDNINKGLNTSGISPKSTNSVKDTLYEWDSSYSKYEKIINDIVSWANYNSCYE